MRAPKSNNLHHLFCPHTAQFVAPPSVPQPRHARDIGARERGSTLTQPQAFPAVRTKHTLVLIFLLARRQVRLKRYLFPLGQVYRIPHHLFFLLRLVLHEVEAAPMQLLSIAKPFYADFWPADDTAVRLYVHA